MRDGPGILAHARSVLRGALLAFFFVTAALTSAIIVFGSKATPALAQVFVTGLVVGIIVAIVVVLATLVHFLEKIPYERTLRRRVAEAIGKSAGTAPLVSWTATLLPDEQGSLHVLPREARFVSHDRKEAVALPEDVVLSVPTAEIAAIELGSPATHREWWRAGSETVEIVLANGSTVRLAAVAPRALASALRTALALPEGSRARVGS